MTDIDLPAIQTLALPGGIPLAYRHAPGDGPTIVFLPGYMSDMEGGKACAVMADAMARGQACLLLDYSGCGNSGGEFADGSLSAWRDEVLALLAHVGAGTKGSPVVLVGSSMGGWLMLLIARALVARGGAEAVHGVVGIAAAPDFIEWGYSADQIATLERGEVWLEDNIYGPDPTPYHPGFHADAKSLVQLNGGVDLDCPLRLLHGMEDPDVPWNVSIRLSEAWRGDDVRITLIKGGDHRLSRDEDIALLLATVAQVSA